MDANLRRQIEAFVKPQSVAVIGASERFGSWGSFIMQGLLSWRFPGRIYPVNPKLETVFGIRAYHEIRSVPGPVDLVVLAIPPESIPETIVSCAKRGVKGITIITAGFGEAVDGGREQELELARLARRYGIRLLGPNVSGTFNLHNLFNASASPAHFLIPTPITGICQGGYAIYDLLAASFSKRMGIGQFIHTGNECDLQVVDFLEYFAEDPQTRVILMYLETLREVDRFREVAARLTREKPLIIHKVGRTPGGARAARSHTGAMAGDHALFKALFQQVNIVSCPTMELLLPLAHAFLELPPMKGDRVAIVTMGGSWGVALTDILEERGLKVPALSPSLQSQLREMGMPVRASTRNPIDIGAAGSLAFSVETVREMCRRILSSDEVDALILHGFGRLALSRESPTSSPNLMLEMEKGVLRECSRVMDACGKPLVMGSCLLPSESRAVHDLIQEGLRIYYRLDEIADILHLKHRHHRSLSP